MSLSVQQRAEFVATFRFIQVFLMETIARWVPQTPEMEVKVLFGRHIWELADHLLDEPTTRVVEKILNEFQKMIKESETLRKELPQLCLADKNWPAHLARPEVSVPTIVAHRPSAAIA